MRNPLTFCLISYEAKRVVYQLVVHYSLDFTAYKAASGGVSLRCGTLRALQKHAEIEQGPCKTCQGCCKACRERCKACRGWPRTLPSMPRSCKTSLYILGSHRYLLEFFFYIYSIEMTLFSSPPSKIY